ncbi:MAG: hypothetical protein GX163_12950 [Bacteroidetes bacterium]|nr:hypothetical protein [Bacteroidota bacterium]
MKSLVYIYTFFLIYTCSAQTERKTILTCGNSSVEIMLPIINEIQEHEFTEGKTTLLMTEDLVVIEFYCGGNYVPHINDRERYVEYSKYGNSSRGIDKKTKLYWRKDGNLIYSNCKEKDTAYYNRIFDNKIVK